MARPLYRARSPVCPMGRRTSNAYHLMGIAGVTLEAGSVSQRASRLSAEEAVLAARFATRELNGFSKGREWLLS
ncbi:hypothetical protein SAMN05518866_1354 [Sphingobium sp. YR768]|nr:hypothetical protein SAMN05518866_1354 [Sphingobium sp. YR768]